MDREKRYNRIQIVIFESQIEQQDLAEILRVTPDTVSRWCINKHQPSIQELFKVAEVFRIDVRDLLVPTVWPKEAGPSPVALFRAEKEKRKSEAKIKAKKRPAPKKNRRH
jgi:putative transcriptional regulator